MSLFARTLIINTLLWVLPASAATIFQVTVNTTSLNGQSGVIDLQFNPGGVTSQPASALVTLFTGATLGIVIPPTIGPVTGTLPANNLTFQNSANTDYAHQITLFNNSFQFRIALDGIALTAPNNGPAGTSFGLFLYGPDFVTPLLSADGLIAQIDINPDGTITTTGFPSGNPAATFAVVSDVPEPGTLSSMLIAGSVFALLLRRQSIR